MSFGKQSLEVFRVFTEEIDSDSVSDASSVKAAYAPSPKCSGPDNDIGNYSSKRDRELRKQRTATMNTSSDPTKGTRTIHVHIVDVVQQKEEGYTVIVQPSSDAE